MSILKSKVGVKVKILDDVRRDEVIPDLPLELYSHSVRFNFSKLGKREVGFAGNKIAPAEWRCSCGNNFVNPANPAYDDLCIHFVGYLLEYHKSDLDVLTVLLLKNYKRFGKERLYMLGEFIVGARLKSDWLSVYCAECTKSFAFNRVTLSWFLDVKPADKSIEVRLRGVV